MATGESLSQRIKAEFEARAQGKQAAEQQRAQQEKQREQQLAMFNKVCDDLKGVWGPLIDEFGKQFGEQIKVTPTLQPEQRQARIDFNTDMASVTLSITASCNSSIDKLVLDYDLRIIPMFFDYERNARLEMPLDKIDRVAVGKWVEDRLLACVKTYLSMQENEFYVQRVMIEDPLTKTKFVKDKAAAKLELNGRTVYFASQDSLKEYRRKHQLDEAPKADAPMADAAKAGASKNDEKPTVQVPRPPAGAKEATPAKKG